MFGPDPPQTWGSKHIFHKPPRADFMIRANNNKSPFLALLRCPFTVPPIQLPVLFSQNLIHKHQSIIVSTQLITVASVASMHSFTSASEQTVEAAANGNILLFTGQWMFSPWLFLLICGTL